MNTRLCQQIFVVIVMTLGLVTLVDRPAVAANITVTKPGAGLVVPEALDFASEKFADPWDLSDYADLSGGQYMNDFATARVSKGVFTAFTNGTDSAFHPLFPGYEGVQFNGRDGYINRISTERYNRFSIRMYASELTNTQIFWFYNQRWTNFGSKIFLAYPGWHTYIIDLPETEQWHGRPLGFRVDPSHETGVEIRVDWMRLFRQSSQRVKLEWLDQLPIGQTELYISSPTLRGDMELIDTVDSQAQNSYMWDPSAYPPGEYRFYLKKSGQPGVYSESFTISALPLIRILDPDEKGGADYATTVMKNPWDMKNRKDIWYWRNLKRVRFRNGVMSSVPRNGDGYFHLRVKKPIKAKKFHRLVFRFRYDGSFDYGAGTMSRVIWSRDHNNLGLFQTINDIVTYPKWTTYVIDLKKADLDGGNIGWRGLVNDFRFDPLEWRARRRFYVDYIKIKADDSANQKFRIKWRDRRRVRPRTKVSLFYDGNKRGFNGRLIKRNLTLRDGTNTYLWWTKKVRPGRYFVYLTADDGLFSIKRYSDGPILIKHPKKR